MGQPVVHFEVVARDGEKLQSYYAELFDWDVNAENEMKYGLVDRESNSNSEGIGLGGGIGQGPDGYEGHVTFYVEVPNVEEALSKAESLGGTRVMGPETIMGRMVLGQFKESRANVNVNRTDRWLPRLSCRSCRSEKAPQAHLCPLAGLAGPAP